MESLALKVLGENLSITQPAVVGLQATSFSVKRRPKDSKPQTEAQRHHLRETTAAGEEPTRAGRGLKGPRVEGGFLGQGHGTGGPSAGQGGLCGLNRIHFCVLMSPICVSNQRKQLSCGPDQTRRSKMYSVQLTRSFRKKKKNLTQMFQIVRFHIKSQISNLS